MTAVDGKYDCTIGESVTAADGKYDFRTGESMTREQRLNDTAIADVAMTKGKA